MDRGAAAKVGGMDRQTLRDWVRRRWCCLASPAARELLPVALTLA